MNATALKKTLPYVPEILLLLASICYFVAELITSSSASYIAIASILIIATLILWKNKFLATALSIILGLASIYMLLAVVSEYNEFPPGDGTGLQLLLTGVLIFTTLLVIAFMLPKKYYSK